MFYLKLSRSPTLAMILIALMVAGCGEESMVGLEGAAPDGIAASRPIPQRVCLDVMPGVTGNWMNVKQTQRLTVAVLGTADCDVFQIDCSSVNIFGSRPVRIGFFDVAAPAADGSADGARVIGPDGREDLVLEFLAMDVFNCSGHVHDHSDGPMDLTIWGNLKDGTPFYGVDWVEMHGVPGCSLGLN